MRPIRILVLIALIANSTLSVFSQTGIIKGRVYDALSNEPLPFVNVAVSETTKGGVTDENGNFVIDGLVSGYYKIVVSFLGYETVTTEDIYVTNSKSGWVEVAMQETNTKLEEVKVKASPFVKDEESPVSLQRISVSEIESNPGSNRDISKVIQSFPGVGGGVSFRNDIIIRGGGPSESRFYLDGVEIPNLNHFATQGASGGPVGIINADFIGGVKFYSGAFPANRGNALSGVFEFSQIDGNKEKLRFRGALGASEMSATFDTPLGKKGTLLFSVRRSYLQFLFDALGLPFLPTFTDYQLKYRARLDPKNELTIVSIGALDEFKLNTGLEDPDESQQYILTYLPVNEQWSYAIGGVWKHFMEHGYHTTVFSRNMLNNVSYKYPENDESQARVYDYVSQEIENKARYEYTSRIGEYKYNVGSGLEYAKYTNETYQQYFAQGQLSEINYQSDVDLVKYSAFGQVTRKFFDERFITSLGVRLDGNSYSTHMQNPFNQLSPRMSAMYALFPKVNVNANFGRYYQLPAYTTLGYRDNNSVLINKENNLKYIGVYHYIGGFDYRPVDNIVFSLEGFYKQYDQYPVSVRDQISLATKGSDFGVIGDEEVLSDGKGNAYGVEFMNRIQNASGLTTVTSYTWVRSTFVDKNGNDIPTTWDSEHLLTVTASKKIKEKWQVGGKFRFVGGLPYTPYDMDNSSLVEVWNAYGKPIPDYNNINGKRFSAYHQLDVRVDRKWFFDKWSFMMYLDIQNVYNSQSDQQDIVIRDTDDQGNFITTDGGSRYQLRRISNSSGTVLPTIGIMIEF